MGNGFDKNFSRWQRKELSKNSMPPKDLNDQADLTATVLSAQKAATNELRNMQRGYANQQGGRMSELDRLYSTALAELEALQGLDSVVNQIKEILAYGTISKRRKELGLTTHRQSLHMVFKGAPGTGKTTVARIVGKLFVGAGLLTPRVNRRPQRRSTTYHGGYGMIFDEQEPVGEPEAIPFVECSNSDITSSYWGQDETNMKKKFDEADGGVLFIDEAYSMFNTARKGGYESKVAAVIVKEMEDRRENVCLIAAGYSEEMDDFVQYNPGFASRFAGIILFHNYELDQLLTIADSLAEEQHYVLSSEFRSKLKARLSHERHLHTFGNARTVRNIMEQSIRKHSRRVFDQYGSTPSREVLTRLEVDDLEPFNPELVIAKSEVQPFGFGVMPSGPAPIKRRDDLH